MPVSEPGRLFHTLSGVARTVNSSLDVMQILESIAATTAESLGAKACSLRLLGPDDRHLMLGVAHGLSAGYRAKGPVLTEQSRVDDLALDDFETVVIPDATADSRFQYPDAAREEGIVSVLVTPLRVQDHNIGVLRIYMPEWHEFSADERELAEAIASLSALAIENGRLYERLDRNYRAAVEFPPGRADASQRHEVAPGALAPEATEQP
jgi:GAF domain-containing protein